MDPPVASRRLRTGLYEIDLKFGEVRKNGRKLPLQEQPFRVLAMLLERPGEVITREELQARLWSADTYVGFDEGINTAIRKLRLVFGDSADNPRFIETLPRRGYRFIAPVSEVATADGGAPPTDTRWRKPARTLVGIAASLVLVLAGVVLLRHWRAPSSSASTKRSMLAILPFQNLSNDPGQEYLSDGLTEETITDVGELSPAQLGVIARTSAMSYKHTDKTISQIGRELGVDYILEGSVRREGQRIRVSAQLIRVSDQTHIWAQNYDRDLQDMLDLQNDLGKAIADQIQANLTPQRRSELARAHTVDPEAYDLYLKGRFFWNQRTPEAIKESIQYFQQATAKDPNFALGYVGLADAYNISNILGTYTAQESLPEARTAASKAIALDPSLAEAHAALGMEKSHYEFDFPGAEREFLKAIELNPNSAYAHLFYSNCYLMPMGERAEAIAENKKALELDPLSLPINNFMGTTYYLAGDYERSYQQYEHTIAMDPSFPLAHEYFSALLLTMGNYQAAIREHEKSELLSGASPEEATAEAETMLKVWKTEGEKGFWQERLEFDRRAMKRSGAPISASVLSWDYAGAGQKDNAFGWLEKAYDAHEGGALTLLKADPFWKNLRGDPRFSELLRRMGLPE